MSCNIMSQTLSILLLTRDLFQMRIWSVKYVPTTSYDMLFKVKTEFSYVFNNLIHPDLQDFLFVKSAFQSLSQLNGTALSPTDDC